MQSEDRDRPLNLPFSQTDPLTTPRLTLRPFQREDHDALGALQRTAGIARFLLWDVPDDQELDLRLEEKIQSTLLAETTDRFCVVIEWRNCPGMIGEASLVVENRDQATFEIGYIVHPDVSGSGIAQEAARALVDFAFLTLNAHRVVGRIDARNVASQRVLERLGMREEAHFRSDQFIKGEWTDEVVFAILQTEWPEPN